MHKNYQKLIKILGETRVLLSESLAKYSTMRLGGPADLFFRAKSKEDLIFAVNSAQKLSIPIFVLGGGTNLLIDEDGFRGLVVKNDSSGIKIIGMKGKQTGIGNNGRKSTQTVFLEVESGVSINRLVRFTIDASLSGLEYFLGQPGTVGGAMYINAHNMNQGIFWSDRVVEAKILKIDGKVVTVGVNYFRFGYDQSIIQSTREIVLSIVLALDRGEKTKLWQEASRTLAYRQKTQPTGVYSSGCTFRNIAKSDAIRLATPNFTTSAGFLLESVGLKGFKIGQAMFSNHHANFIIHQGGGKTSDVLKLINLAKKRVKEKYNIDLQEEIVLVGDFN